MERSSDIKSLNNSRFHNQKDESFEFSFTKCSILLFVPREKWKSDSMVTHCFNCNNEFFFLIRRKHHCRKCGNIFCGNCSNFFLNTEKIGLKNLEKITRLCQYCFQGTQNYLNLMRKENSLRKSLLHKNSIEEVGQAEYSSGDFDERQKILMGKISTLIDFQAGQNPRFLDLEFKSRLMKILSSSLEIVHLDTVNKNDYMDINRYIKIKKIRVLGIEKPEIEYIEGIICSKNVSDRKMKSCFDYPNILIISPSIDLPNLNEKKEYDGPVQLEILLQNERKMMKKTVETLLKLQPNVIFVENSVNRIASDMLKSQGITLFVKVKSQLLKRIARLTKAKILISLQHLHKIGRNVIGNCDKLSTKKFYTEDQKKDPTLLYLEGCNAESGGTIALKGENLEELIKIKNAIKVLLRLGRHIILEHEIVYIERKMQEEMRKTYSQEFSAKFVQKTVTECNINGIKKPEETLNAGDDLNLLLQSADFLPFSIFSNFPNQLEFKEGDFSNFLDNKLGMLRFFKRDFIQYTKIHLVKAIVENHIDIIQNPQALQELNNKKYCPNECFSELCGSPSVNRICYYSSDDITLGKFIINKVKNLFTRCERENCNRPRNNHLAIYYQGEKFVKISVEITGFIRATTLNSDGKYMIIEDNKGFESMSNSENSQTKINNLNFKTYLACEKCGFKLVEEKTLEKPYLEYSFTRFLSHFFVNDKKNGKNEESLIGNAKKCSHLSRKRVFRYGEFLINFSSGCLKIYDLQFKKMKFKKNIEKIEEKSLRILMEKKDLYLQKFKKLIITIINILKSSINELIIEENEGISQEKMKSSLEILLNKIQFFALSIETSLNSPFSCYLDLEYQRLQLASQFSNFIEIFFQYFSKKQENSNKIESLALSISQLSVNKSHFKELSLEKSLYQSKEKTLSPKLRPPSKEIKRSLSSNKGLGFIKEETVLFKSIFTTIKDIRFSTNPREKPIICDSSEKKLGFLKENLSKFSDKNEDKLLSIFYEKNSDKKLSEFSDKNDDKNLSGFSKNDDKNLSDVSDKNDNKNLSDVLGVFDKNDDKNFSDKNDDFNDKNDDKNFSENNDDKNYSNKNFSGFSEKNLSGFSEKKLSGFSQKKKYEKKNTAFSEKIDDSVSDKEDCINELLEKNPFELLAEDENHFENSPFEELDCVSPNFLLEEIPLKKSDTSNLEETFKDLKILNSGQSLSYLNIETSRKNLFFDILQYQKYKYIPIYENEPITIIAQALNSLNYLKEVYIEGGFHKYEQEINLLRVSKDHQSAFKKLPKTHLEKKKLQIPSHFLYKTSIIKPFLLNSELIKTSDESPKLDIQPKEFIANPLIRKKKLIKTSILVYYAKQFEALRMDNGILLSSFIRSLGCSSQWQENSGGKSKASFIKSFDDLYIFKELEKKEFSMFFNYAYSYFDYIWKSSNKKRPSVLSKIYGLFEVKIKNSHSYYIAMENLFFGIDPLKELNIYDLKGSETNRYTEKKRKNQTLLDTNFKIDQNGEPLTMKTNDKKFLDISFENDTRFLNKHNLVDYSLLVIIDQENNIIRVGIIDYLREYTWDKKVETVAKKISKGGATPTIVSPADYRERFKKAMGKYFMDI